MFSGGEQMGRQLSIYLDENEVRQLMEVSIKQCRRPQDQARFILRSVLMNEPSAEMTKPASLSVSQDGQASGFGIGNQS